MTPEILSVMALLGVIGLAIMWWASRRTRPDAGLWPGSWSEAIEKMTANERRIGDLQHELDLVKRENQLLNDENRRLQETQKLLLRQLADMQQRVSSLEHDIETLQKEKTRNQPVAVGELRQTLATKFDENELRALAFDLSVDLDALPGNGLLAKATELVAYFERRGQMRRLADEVWRLRPS